MREPGVEDWVGLGVTLPAGLALGPYDVASSIKHHVHILGGGPEAEAREVLPAALREPGYYGAAEVLSAGVGAARGVTRGPGGGGCKGGEGVHALGVALEAEGEELVGGGS